MPALITVLVVDDHAVIRVGLARLLASTDDLLVLGTASSGEAAIAMCDELRPDVVLMDIALPGIGGIEATRAITKRWPATRVVMLTTYEECDQAEQAIEAGASGYLNKRISPEALLECIRMAPHDWVSLVEPHADGRGGRPRATPLPPLGLRGARPTGEAGGPARVDGG